MPPRQQFTQKSPSPIGNTANQFQAKLQTNTPVGEAPTAPKSNEDLKKLIESLKAKMGTNTPGGPSPAKKSPPNPNAKWDRSIRPKISLEPAYTVLTRISNHEKIPTNKKAEVQQIKSLPHSFLYKPGADGIKVDKLEIKAGKQICFG